MSAPGAITTVAVKDGRLAGLGGDPEELRRRCAGCEILSFPGRCLLPGFWDTHAHVERLGAAATSECMLYEVDSIAGLVGRLAEFAAGHPEYEAIRGRAGCLHPATLAEGRMPDRRDLDRAVPDRPLVVHDVNKAVANSASLAAAGIGPDTADPPGGLIERAADGRPSGICRFRGGQKLFDRLAPGLPTFTPEVFAEMFEAGCRTLAARGVTTVVQAYATTREIRAVARLDAEGRLPCRTILHPAAAHEGQFEDFLSGALPFGQRLGALSHVGPLKIIYDLFVMHRTAKVSVPFAGQPENRGVYNIRPEELARRVDAALDRGFPLAVHATGDAGLTEAVDALGRAFDRRGGAGAVPAGSFIIHGYFAPPGLPERMAALGLGLAAQPVFHWAWADQLEELVGPERTADFYPYDRYLAAGVRVGGGSDAPVAWFDPLRGMAAAVTRRSASGRVWGAEHAVSVETALSFFTDGAAALFPWSGLSGRLAPGEPADFVVLDRDPRAVPIDEIHRARVLATYVAGRRVYVAEG